jgi:hypothetical protein
MTKQSDNLDTSLESLRKLAVSAELKAEERDALKNEFAELEAMIKKLDTETVEITAFGEINVGKSSLLNAMLDHPAFGVDARGGKTQEKEKTEWSEMSYRVEAMAQSRVYLVDTPGLNEVGGQARAQIAERTVRDTDIVLFVIDSDLNEVEYQALKRLHDLNKPIIVCINKCDTFRNRERREVFEAVRDRLSGMVSDNNIIFVAADPMEREFVVQADDGTDVVEIRKPAPIVEDLEVRVLEILNSEGKAVVALNAMLFASTVSKRIDEQKQRYRSEAAEKIIHQYMIYKSMAVAVNPVAVADIVGAVGFDYAMVQAIGKIYGSEVTVYTSGSLLKEIAMSAAKVTAIEFLTHGIAHVAKALSFGAAAVVTAVPQALVAGWSTYIAGQAAHIYFQQGSTWGPGGPAKVIEQIIKAADKDSILAELTDKIKGLLKAR